MLKFMHISPSYSDIISYVFETPHACQNFTIRINPAFKAKELRFLLNYKATKEVILNGFFLDLPPLPFLSISYFTTYNFQYFINGITTSSVAHDGH